MPITPLHLAAGLPLRHWLRQRFSLAAFIAVNILIDLEPGLIMFFNMDSLGYPLHGTLHTLAGTTGAGLLVAACAPRRAVLIGAMIGAWSHLLLDALVHTDVQPLWPIAGGNPLYQGWMEPVSLICLLVVLAYAFPWLLLRVRQVSRRLLG